MLKSFSEKIVKNRIMVLILAVLLLIPTGIGYVNTKVNYDMLTYLPRDIDTMKGQEILKEEFGTGAFSMLICRGMSEKDTAALKEKVEQVEHVKDVLWYDSFLDLSIPMEMLPDEVYKAFNHDDATMMFVIFDETTSEEGTMSACEEIRRIAGSQCFLSGMTAVLIDTKNLSDQEAPVYVGIAVLLSVIVLMLAMDSWLVPFLFLVSIGMAVVYNLGTNNLILGQISYLTKAIAAVLQLGVTMDYSIFLWHSYSDHLNSGQQKDEAMRDAIMETMTSIVGSSITTIAGFIALCFMSFTLGLDLGLVMAKGVLLGVIACVTILPAMILTFDKAIQKTRHRVIMPDLGRAAGWVIAHNKALLAAALIILGPALYGYTHTRVYYNLDRTLPRDFPSIIANAMQAEEFNQQASHALLIPANVKAKDIQKMADEMKETDGVKFVLGLNTVKGAEIPDAFIPDKAKNALISKNWQLLLIGSEYPVASPEVNAQIDRLQEIAKSYDEKAMLIGESPATKDLIQITDHDFTVVSSVSIGIIFLIIAVVFGSWSLPFILVAVIEFGIFINLGIPAFTNTELPFIASIVVGTIQLGSTVDYAILLTTRYRRSRTAGIEKKEAVRDALANSAKSVLVSALAFFAATFGVGAYSTIDMISSLCTLMARGALISMICVIFVLPSILLLADPWITKTSRPQKA